ncbi:hypothetical protein M5K25_021712 [Dendrobium thyrsiflorum]|uniref:Uncharacterized protein n=1 Tax=Dendrobium thyrsiflorum TaxID=117978 RepID=A0ABD0UAG2_DENTH
MNLILRSDLFHYGSISLISEPCRSARLAALRAAKAAVVLCSYERVKPSASPAVPRPRRPALPRPRLARQSADSALHHRHQNPRFAFPLLRLRRRSFPSWSFDNVPFFLSRASLVVTHFLSGRFNPETQSDPG